MPFRIIPHYTEPPVRFRPYDRRLACAFGSIRQILSSRLPGAEVEHIGSTAVPGLGGKGILDALVVTRGDLVSVASELGRIGFRRSPYPQPDPGRRLLVATALDGAQARPVHLHLTYRGSIHHFGWISFRDRLRSDPDLAAEYAEIKRRTISSGADRRVLYNLAKTPFIRSLAFTARARPRRRPAATGA